MKKHSLLVGIILVVFCFFIKAVLPLHAQRAKTLKEQTVKIDSMLLPSEKNASYYFIQAVVKANTNKEDSALLLLDKALALDANNDAALFYKAKLLVSSNKDSLALPLIEKAVQLNPKNNSYLSLLGMTYIAVKQPLKAAEIFEKVVALRPSDLQILNILRAIYTQTSRGKELLAVLDKMEAAGMNDEEMFLDRLNTYQWLDNEKGAYALLESYARKYSDKVDYKVMLGNWLMQKHRPKQAYKVYQEVQKIDPQNENLLGALYDYYVETGDSVKAQETQQHLLFSESVSYETKLSIFKNLLADAQKNKQDSLMLLPLINKMIASTPAERNVWLLRGAYLQLQKAPDTLQTQAMKEALTAFPDLDDYRMELLQQAAKSDNEALADSLAVGGIKNSPQSLGFYYFHAMTFVRQKKHKEALNTLLSAVRNAPETADSAVIGDFYALIGDLYHELNENDKAFEAYEIAIKKNPNNMSSFNNYAYFLSIEGGDLAKAEALSRVAIEKEPNSVTYLDTYAWILFLQKKYDKAKEYIDKALVPEHKDDIDNTLLDHAGDIYMALKQPQEAIAFWQKSLSLEPNNADVLSKIQQAVVGKNKKQVKKNKSYTKKK